VLNILSGVCTFCYPARKTHAPYFIFICDWFTSAIFFTLFHIRNGYRKELNTEYASSFSVQSLLETFLNLSRTEEINDKCI